MRHLAAILLVPSLAFGQVVDSIWSPLPASTMKISVTAQLMAGAPIGQIVDLGGIAFLQSPIDATFSIASPATVSGIQYVIVGSGTGWTARSVFKLPFPPVALSAGSSILVSYTAP